MSAFTENKWETDKLGDKLNKQLFKTDRKELKKNCNSKFINSNVKKNRVNRKNSVDDNVKITQNHIDKNNEKVSKKRSLKTSNSNKNLNNKKKFKSSTESNDITTKKNNSNGHSIKVNNNEVKNICETAGKNKKNPPPEHKNITANKKTKLKQKNKNNENTEKINKIDIKKIQELLQTKKVKNKNYINKSLSLRERMMAQLRGSRFRYLNETLYNNQSFESRKMFKDDPDAFKAYHTGYRQQVEQWPLNPLDIIISAIKKMPKDHIIADFGCGDGRLADSVEQKVHSLDLIATNDKIIACDMAHTSLLTNGINVVVFCLSLMGSNLSDYIIEANRVLKKDGILKIADIESRFDNIDEFIKSLGHYGFKNTWKDLSNNLFYFMDFKKITDINRNDKKLPIISLKACLYKKR